MSAKVKLSRKEAIMKKRVDKDLIVVSPNFCPNANSECQLTDRVRRELKDFEGKMQKSVLLGAAIGSGLAGIAKDLLDIFL